MTNTSDDLVKWPGNAVCDCRTCKLWRELDETRNKAAARIRELEAERDRWESLAVKAWKDMDTMGFQNIHKHFGNGPTHVIVPVEPTEVMDNAGAEAIVKHYNHYEAGAVTDVYEAMIRAAQEDTQPEPPSEGRE